jgi:hypothetical protein
VLCTRIKVSEERRFRERATRAKGVSRQFTRILGVGIVFMFLFRLRFILQPLHICLPGVSGVGERVFLDAVGL